MILSRTLGVLSLILLFSGAFAGKARADGIWDFTLSSIDGGEIALSEWQGHPVLIVNTASLCGFTPQLEGLQQIWDTYREAGLKVLAVPSDDFNQELSSEAEVKEFCALNYATDMPMTVITPVRGQGAHPLYRWLAGSGVAPGWNFHKVLIGANGEVIGAWGSTTRPMAPAITRAVEAALAGS